MIAEPTMANPILVLGSSMVTLAVVVVKAGFDVRGGRRRDKGHTAFQEHVTKELGGINISLAELRTFSGIDNENGLRGQMNRLARAVEGIENRERQDLRDEIRARDIGTFQPPR